MTTCLLKTNRSDFRSLAPGLSLSAPLTREGRYEYSSNQSFPIGKLPLGHRCTDTSNPSASEKLGSLSSRVGSQTLFTVQLLFTDNIIILYACHGLAGIGEHRLHQRSLLHVRFFQNVKAPPPLSHDHTEPHTYIIYQPDSRQAFDFTATVLYLHC